MSTAGITSEGFVALRLEEIKLNLEEKLRDAYGDNVNLLPESTLGQLIGIFSDRVAEIWELAECVYNSQYPATAEGVQLDNIASLTGITRLPATNSNVDLLFKGVVGTIIPAGFLVSVNGNEDSKFATAAAAAIIAGQNEIQTISFDAIPDAGDFSLNLNGEITSLINFNDNASVVETAFNNLPSVSSVLVTGDFSAGFAVEFTGANELTNFNSIALETSSLMTGPSNVQITIVETQEGRGNEVSVPSLAQVTGPVTAPSGTLTVIDVPLTGIDSVNNPLDAELGRDIETDSELKIRRELSLQRAGAATVSAIKSRLLDIEGVIAALVFENFNNIPDAEGRPPHSYEAIVQGGDEDEICDTIWVTKPAGIETVGNTTCNITDSEGFPRVVKFSRPSEVEIYLELDLSVGTDFPADGVQQIIDKIVSFGNALPIGEDIVVYPKLISQLCVVSDVLDVAVRIGNAPSPTLDDNIILAANEVSVWDTSRITVNLL